MAWSSVQGPPTLAQLKNPSGEISLVVNVSFESPLEPHYNGSSRLCVFPNPALDDQRTQGPVCASAMDPQVLQMKMFSRNNSFCCLPLPWGASPRLPSSRGSRLRVKEGDQVFQCCIAGLRALGPEPLSLPLRLSALPRTIQTCNFRLTEITRSRCEITGQDSVLLTCTCPQEQQTLCASFKRVLTHLFTGNLHAEGWTSPITANRLRKSTVSFQARQKSLPNQSTELVHLCDVV